MHRYGSTSRGKRKAHEIAGRRYDNAGAGMDMSPRCPRLPAAFAVLLTAACLCCLSSQAWAQSTFYYGGGSRTWSNAQSWWQSYLATAQTQSGSAPMAADTAIFNTSGSNTSGTAVFTGDASLSRLLVLQTATGGLVLRGDGVASPTLTLGSGGIRVQPGNTSALTLGGTGNQALGIALNGSQQWQLAGNALTVSGTVFGTSGTGASQTLFIGGPAGIAATNATFTDGTAGGRLNLWINNRGSASNTGLSPTAAGFTGVLTLQNSTGTTTHTASAFSTSGTYSGFQELRLAGGAATYTASATTNTLAINPSGTIRMLGGASQIGANNSVTSSVTGLGTLARSPGGGFLQFTGPNNNAVITATGVTATPGMVGNTFPWMIFGAASSNPNEVGLRTVSGSSLVAAPSVSLGNSINLLPLLGSGTANQYFGYGRGSFDTFSASREGAVVNVSGQGTPPVFDLNGFSFTTNGIVGQGGWATTQGIGLDAQSIGATTFMSRAPGGVLRIGSFGDSRELVIGQWSGNTGGFTFAIPIEESLPGSWLTVGSFNSTAPVTLSGSNSHSGGTSIVSSGLNINNAYALGSGTFRIGGNAIVLDNKTAGPITVATNNLHEWNSDFAFAGTQDLNLGTGTVSLGTWAGSLRTVTVNAGNLTVGGRIENGTFADLPTTGLAKNGPGTLILSGSNGYTGATEVWGGELRFANRNALYGGGTASWTVANLTTGSGAILSVSVGDQAGAFNSADLDILDGAVGGPIGGYLGIDTTGATSGTFTYATNIPNPAADRILGIAKVGTGTLVLSGSNTFTGGALARGGRLLVTSTSQVGSGTLVAAGGLLDLNGLTATNAFSITSGTIANTSIDRSVLTAAVTGPAVISATLTGTSNWAKSGTGTLALAAANTFTGTTTVSGGLLSISSDANLNGTASALVFNGGGLQVTGTSLTSLATARPTVFTSNTSVTFDIADPANTFTVTQNLQQGTGGLTKSGSGTLVAGGTNTYAGVTSITGGTLRLGSATGLGGATGGLNVLGGVLDLGGFSVTKATGTFNGVVTNGTFASTAAYQVQSGTVSASLAGGAGLTKSSSRVVVLSGTNTYSGTTTVSGGILVANSTDSLPGWNAGRFFVDQASLSTHYTVLALGSGFSNADAATVLGSGTYGSVTAVTLNDGPMVGFDTSGGNRDYDTAIADAGANGRGFMKLGSGTLVLSASNTYSRATWVGYPDGPNAGVLQLGPAGFVTSTVSIFGGTFDTAGQNRTINTLSLGTGTAGSSASLQTGSGTVTLGGNVTYNGLFGRSLLVVSTNPLGASIGGNLSLGGATRTFTVNDSTAADVDLAVSAVVSQGASTAGLTKQGAGVMALTGLNTFTGKTVIAQGTVQIESINDSGASPLGTNTTTDLGSGMQPGTLRWVGATSSTTSRTFNLAGTTGGGVIDASGAGALVISSTVTATGAGAKTLTLGGTGTAANTVGTILNGSGTTSVVKDGPGLWRINAASGYTGSFTVRNGTLVAAVDSVGTTGAFGDGSVTDVFVGDSSPTASGTASLLLAAGFNTNKVMNVLGGGGSQAVILGGEGGRVDFQGDLYLGRAVALVAGPSGTTFFSGGWKGLSGTGALGANVSFGSPGNTGMVTVSRGLATSGSVGVRFGTLNLGTTGTVAAGAPLGIDAGATLAGIGFVTGTLGGAGLVAPGNSPGILTAGAVDPSSGLDWAFEFTNATPDYTNPSNSLNDILRLTGTAPFTTNLTPANEIAVYLDVASLADGNTFRGGFFTDQPGAFTSSIAAATYTYWVSGSGAGQTTYQTKTYVPLASLYPSLSMGVTTVSDTATFSGGSPTSGQVMQFTVVVPEPGAIALAALGLGLAGYALRRRRLL